MIIQYVRNKQREKIGVIVAIPHGNKNAFSIGWSKCNMMLDDFDWRQGQRHKGWGVELAKIRAVKQSPIVKGRNECVFEEIKDFIELTGDVRFDFIPLIPQSCEAVCQKVINRACRAYGNHCEQISNAESFGYDKLEILTDCGVKNES